MKNILVSSLLVTTVLLASFDIASAQGSDAVSAVSQKSEKQQARVANRALAKRVRAVLYKTKGLTTSGIIVLAKDGVVSLNGTVPDQDQIARAGSAAQSVSGVTSVENYVELAIKN